MKKVNNLLKGIETHNAKPTTQNPFRPQALSRLMGIETYPKRLYLEAMQQVLPHIKEIYIIDEGTQSLIPFLQMSK